MGVTDVQEWGADRLDDLVRLCDAALPTEAVGADDLDALCFAPDVADLDAPGGRSVVLGDDSGAGAVIVSLRRRSGLQAPPTAFVQLLVVDPTRRRRGIARSLLSAAHDWAAVHGARAVQAGGAAPFYLFTGVDSRWVEAVCCFESLGYTRLAVELDMVCPARQARRPVTPPGVVIERVEADESVAELVAWSERHWPMWTAEFTRGAESGSVVVARAVSAAGEGAAGQGAAGQGAAGQGAADAGSTTILGAAAHSVGRLGVIGPVAVQPGLDRGGIGSALMGAVLGDLTVAGVANAEIAWVSTVKFYVRSCGARIGRASQVLWRELPAPAGAVASPS